MARLKGIDPIIRHDAEILVLGSMPGDMSLAKAQYYAHPSNQFWPLMERILGEEELAAREYEERLRILQEHRIGLWDAYESVERERSMDARIINAIPNDFTKLKSLAPRLRLVLFNGKTAGRVEPEVKKLGYKTRVLPSTSAALPIDPEVRLKEWREAIETVTKQPGLQEFFAAKDKSEQAE